MSIFTQSMAGSGALPATWTVLQGTAARNGTGRLVPSVAPWSAFYNASTFLADFEVSATIGTLTFSAVAVFALTDPVGFTGYYMGADPGGISIYDMVGGALGTALVQVLGTFGAGDKIAMRRRGSTLSVVVNDVIRGSVNNSAHPGVINGGMVLNSTGDTVTSFTVSDARIATGAAAFRRLNTTGTGAAGAPPATSSSATGVVGAQRWTGGGTARAIASGVGAAPMHPWQLVGVTSSPAHGQGGGVLRKWATAGTAQSFARANGAARIRSWNGSGSTLALAKAIGAAAWNRETITGVAGGTGAHASGGGPLTHWRGSGSAAALARGVGAIAASRWTTSGTASAILAGAHVQGGGLLVHWRGGGAARQGTPQAGGTAANRPWTASGVARALAQGSGSVTARAWQGSGTARALAVGTGSATTRRWNASGVLAALAQAVGAGSVSRWNVGGLAGVAGPVLAAGAAAFRRWTITGRDIARAAGNFGASFKGWRIRGTAISNVPPPPHTIRRRSAMLDLQIAIDDALQATPAFVALVADRVYSRGTVPKEAVAPYLELGDSAERSAGVFMNGGNANEETFVLVTPAKLGKMGVGRVYNAIVDALDSQRLAMSGHRMLTGRVELVTTYPDPDTKHLRTVIRYTSTSWTRGI